MIQVQELVFEYPGVRALDGVGFQVARGEIAALVGPNGAGKSTLLRCLAGLDRPLTGSIEIDGIDVLEQPRECHRRIGYLADFFGLYDELTVRQCLTYVAWAHKLTAETVAAAVERAARRLHVDGRLSDKVGTLSRGLRQRVAIAQALVHEPTLLLLDEPASGLDPEARHDLAELFLELQRDGMTLLVSSHILAELQEYATTMLILRHGVIVEHRQLEGGEGALTVAMRVVLSEPYPGLAQLLQSLEGVADVRAGDGEATFRCPADAAVHRQLLKALVQHGVPVSSFAEQKLNLQDAYLTYVQRSGAGPS